MNKTQRILNIAIGLFFCGFLEYFFWHIPDVMGVDVSLHELESQNPSLAPKVMIWRIISLVLTVTLFGYIVKKNTTERS